ncbi:hypothetical protein BLIN101_03296 [Brevibacterium linens]|uniref:Uncharacterized protein n=2 Tax=Brevibacterium linens TaxID=1703 RepID=A0A2H1KF80_BRELN|nr:hypothetical protein BLIN101_03296 [Brevibacterium linens]
MTHMNNALARLTKEIAQIEAEGPFEAALYGNDGYHFRIFTEDILVGEDLSGLSEDEIIERIRDWTEEPENLDDAFEGGPWTVFDWRFASAQRVREIEVTDYDIGDVEDTGLLIDVAIRETDAGFAVRLESERAARER